MHVLPHISEKTQLNSVKKEALFLGNLHLLPISDHSSDTQQCLYARIFTDSTLFTPNTGMFFHFYYTSNNSQNKLSRAILSNGHLAMRQELNSSHFYIMVSANKDYAFSFKEFREKFKIIKKMSIIKKKYPSVSHVPNVSKHVGLFLISQNHKTEVSLYKIPPKPASHQMIIDYSGIQQACKVFKLKNA